ncbi:MAG: photosystem II S4 domain protein [Halanaerobiaceae bacterium]|nr:photosystem II S4 domain protein [Halanaerobiaceae bacterium]
MIDRVKISSHLHREEDELLAGYIFDKIEMVIKKKSQETTNFMNPHECEIASGLIRQVSEVNYKIDGGYEGAERSRIIIFPEYLFPDHVKTPISLLKVSGNFKFQGVTHRDYLGALMGLGVKREMIGDIVIMDDFAQIFLADEIKDFVLLNLKNVHEVSVEVKELAIDDFIFPLQRFKEIMTTVASMRLDAIASAGFSDSRNRISREIKNQKVKLNHRLESDPSVNVEIGDLISIQGRGRVKVAEKIGVSQRGRIKLLLQRYL